MVEEEVEEVFGFLIFVSNDTTGETLVHIQSLFTRDGMNTNKRMLYLFDESKTKKEMLKQSFFFFYKADCANLIFLEFSANGTISLSRELGLMNARV